MRLDKHHCPECNKQHYKVVKLELMDELTFRRHFTCVACKCDWHLDFPLKTEGNSYTYITIPSIFGVQLLHRWVWEQAHNTTLAVGQIIHHLNGIKSDNRPSNLYALFEEQHTGVNHNRNQVITKLKKRIRQLESELQQLKLN